MNRLSPDIKHYRLFEPLIIGFFWILIFSSPLMFGRFENGIDRAHLLKIWKEDLVLLGVFIINRFFLLPFLFFRNRRALYIMSTALLIIVVVSGRFIIYKKAAPRKPSVEVVQRPQGPPQSRPGSGPQGNREREIRKPQPGNQAEPLPPYVNLLILSVLVIGFDTGLRVTSKWSQSEQKRIKLEKENVENQLAFLRNQVSPHFFMNTLNNIHALIDYDSGEAKKSIIELSNLMRHLLYDSNSELSPLKNEVEFIRSYVDLMKLRYSKKVRISLDLPLSIPDKSIPPLIFTSLLENAFKHGISYSTESFIEIELTVIGDILYFRIANSKIPQESDLISGIGIENTRKRLDLLFGERYTFETIDEGTVFITNLKIPV
jgi:hypothetical protein